MKKVLRTIGVLLLIIALAVSLIPMSDVEAASSTSDFQMEGNKLVKYSGTAEVVSIPDDVRYIGEEAFAGNDYIVKVNVGDKVKDIGYRAFADCKGLRTVVVGNDCEQIAQAAFSSDPALNSVTFGTGLKKIGSAVFAGDDSLKDIVNNSPDILIEDDIVYDKDKKHLYCMLPSYENGEYVMPNSVNEVSGYAFWGNDSIKNVKLGSGLVSVPEYAFSNCKNLKQIIIPLPVKSIDAKAFENCVNLSSVMCPESLSNISESAFDGCPNVTFIATSGTYADEFAKSFKRSEIEEVEYEDVDQSQVVTTQTVSNSVQPTNDNVVYDVVEGSSHEDENTSTDNEEVQDEDTSRVNGANPPSDESGQNVTVNNAKYKSGVINGSDVVTYVYYDQGNEINGDLLGSSPVVGGRALVFIDNNANVRSGETQGVDLTWSESQKRTDIITDVYGNELSEDPNSAVQSWQKGYVKEEDTEAPKDLSNILADDAKKGRSFPKFTVADNAVAMQAYYNDQGLTEYEFPEGINRIGDFAFSRSALTQIDIPDGVTQIGYGAFYHCDNLNEVNIPSSVTKIGAYAFDNTAFLDNNKDEFVILGDGVLIAYNGNDSVITIPEGVKLIADGAFKDHMGITAVNFADTLMYIGEDAFRGCKNLKTLNRGGNITSIGANAFKDTKLSNVTIGDKVMEIGLGAFDIEGGTDTVTFLGDTIPALISGTDASRLSNEEDRNYAFGDISNAVINTTVTNIKDTVLEPGKYGFKGMIYDSNGNKISDNTIGAVICNAQSGVALDINSAVFVTGAGTGALIEGDEGSYILHISDSQNAKEKIAIAYGDLYGGREPENLVGFDMMLMDNTDTISIEKLGKQNVKVSLPLPDGISTENLHMVCLDSDNQLEAVEYSISDDENPIISFTCEHFSPYGLYNYAGNNADVDKEGEHIKDDTPDTGDYGLHPKWFLVIGCLAGAIALWLLSIKKEE